MSRNCKEKLYFCHEGPPPLCDQVFFSYKRYFGDASVVLTRQRPDTTLEESLKPQLYFLQFTRIHHESGIFRKPLFVFVWTELNILISPPEFPKMNSACCVSNFPGVTSVDAKHLMRFPSKTPLFSN